MLENEISIFKKLLSRKKQEVLQNVLVNGCSDVGFQKTQWTNTSRWHCTPNHHRLWKLNTGLQETWAMSFSTLLPDSRTLVSKLNTKLDLIWKEDFGPLGNSPVLLLLSPGKMPLTRVTYDMPLPFEHYENEFSALQSSFSVELALPQSYLGNHGYISNLRRSLGWLCIFFFHTFSFHLTFC